MNLPQTYIKSSFEDCLTFVRALRARRAEPRTRKRPPKLALGGVSSRKRKKMSPTERLEQLRNLEEL